MKPPICIDFDGVLNEYNGYNKDNLGKPKLGAEDFLRSLSEMYDIKVLTARKYIDVIKWLNEYDLLKYVVDVTSFKPPAVAYIDDRAICFTGDFDAVLEEAKHFKPYWKE